MADFTITIDCNNQAWFNDAEGELTHVLAQLDAKTLLNAFCGSKTVLRTTDGAPTGLATVAPITFDDMV